MRRGQQTFRRRLLRHTKFCEVTLCELDFVLDACHIKPFEVCTEEERDDPNNAICLMANIHRAFDSGYISFDEEGYMMISCLLTEYDRVCLGITEKSRICMPGNRPEYLAYHRENVFKD